MAIAWHWEESLLPYTLMSHAQLVKGKVDCSGKRLMVTSVGKFEEFETHFRIK
jgi:hypothetical protein